MKQPPGPGSWILDDEGEYIPNPNDPATVERYGLKKDEKEVKGHVSNAKK